MNLLLSHVVSLSSLKPNLPQEEILFSISLCIPARDRRDPAFSRYVWQNIGSWRVSHSGRKNCWVFKTWEAEEVLKCSLWRARFDSYSGKPLTPKKLNCQVAMPLKCILGLFKLFHARLLGLLLCLFLNSFINVTKLNLEGSGISSPATK